MMDNYAINNVDNRMPDESIRDQPHLMVNSGSPGDFAGFPLTVQFDKNINHVNRWGLFSSFLHTVLSFLRRPIEFFTLTEEERLAAGICLGRERRG